MRESREQFDKDLRKTYDTAVLDGLLHGNEVVRRYFDSSNTISRLICFLSSLSTGESGGEGALRGRATVK